MSVFVVLNWPPIVSASSLLFFSLEQVTNKLQTNNMYINR